MLSNLQTRNAVAVSFGRLNVRVALIVAGGSGIDEATAWMFAREGARVSIRDINYRAARSVADSIVAMLFRSSGKANICKRQRCDYFIN